MWIVRIALNRPYTFVVLAVLILFVGPLAILRTPTDIFPEHRHPGRHRGLELRRPVAPTRWSYRIVTQLRARADHDRQRHRAHRVAVAATASRSSRCSSSPARRSRRRSRRSPRSRRRACARCRRARTPPLIITLQRLHRADPAARLVRQEALRAAAVRPRRQLHPHAARHRAGRVDPVAVRRQAAADSGRPRSGRAAGQRACRRPTWSTRSARRT